MRAIGGPWSPVGPDGAEAYRYGDPDDAAGYARERARSTGQPWRVVDGLRRAAEGLSRRAAAVAVGVGDGSWARWTRGGWLS